MALRFFSLYKRHLMLPMVCQLNHSQRNLCAPRTGIVDLAFTEYSDYGTSPTNESPIIITHGLLGSKANWHSLSKAINKSTGRKVLTVDQRGHGDSPHHPRFDYEILTEDLVYFIRSRGLSKAMVIGHSLGGRTAMCTAVKQPEIIEKLVVVDISPVSTPYFTLSTSPATYVQALLDLKWDANKSLSEVRKLADQELTKVSESATVRQFLLTNLIKDSSGQIRWRCDLHTISKRLPDLFDWQPLSGLYKGPTLFICGAASSYIPVTDHEAIREIFPKAEFVYIPDASHYVHAEKPREFLDVLNKFLAQ